MSIHAIVPPFRPMGGHEAALPHDTHALADRPRPKRASTAPIPFHFPPSIDDGSHRQAELFYLQKQIQSQTPMVIVLEDGEQLEGCIEWYDRNCLKVRGRGKTMVYKTAIKYMYKLGELGQ